MPKGVEHKKLEEYNKSILSVRTAVMPKGVEHAEQRSESGLVRVV